MSYDTLLRDIEKLPKESYQDLDQYIQFLFYKFNISSGRKERRLGSLKGNLEYIADDFDASMDDFKEYDSDKKFC
ncbi:MAG: DUF2281 domain-containing protein [Bilifractor sp.]